MQFTQDHQLLLTNCPTVEVATKLAHILVEKHLAACVNILPNLHSVYEWQGKIEQSEEILLLIKTRRENYTAIERTLLQLHPYQVPELLAFSIEAGLNKYLAWIDSVVKQSD